MEKFPTFDEFFTDLTVARKYVVLIKRPKLDCFFSEKRDWYFTKLHVCNI